MRKPLLETLEDRCTPSVTLSFDGTSLTATGSPDAPHNVLVRYTPFNTALAVDVVADGVTSTYFGVKAFSYFGQGAQNDAVVNRTPIPGTITVGNGANTVYTVAAGSTVLAGNGNNVLQVVGGNSVITAGNGRNNIYGGPGDTITNGGGESVIYDILPGNTTINVGQHGDKVDHLFVGPNTVLNGAQPQDHVATFFINGRTPGSGTIVQEGGVLYFTPTNNGSRFFVFGDSRLLIVSYDTGDGGGSHIATYAGVSQIAAFGGSGNDLFINSSTVDDVMYGAAGQNTLVGGFGKLDLEKAGGAAGTNSLVIGRSPVYNDLNGSATQGTTTTLVGTPGARNIYRTNNPADLIVNLTAADLVVSLFPDFRTGGH